MTRTLLGQFEHMVLLVILRQGSESYSVDIVQELESHTGKEVATAAVFVALQRLREKGYLKDRLDVPGPEGGHARRYFKLTPKALHTMRAARANYLSLWDGVETQLDGRGK